MKKCTKKQTRGGAREGAGAPKSKDPLVRFWVRVRASKLKELGGEERVKAAIYAMIDGKGTAIGATKSTVAPQSTLAPKAVSVETMPKPAKKAPTQAVNSFLEGRRKNKLGIK